MKPLVLYHSNCYDGYTAAWALWRLLGDGAEYKAVQYGSEPPVDEAKGRRVIIVDFSYPRAKLDDLAGSASLVEIYDHHKTAEADLAGWDRAGSRVVFDMERSGAGIAWDEFHPGVPRPRLVDYVEDRDLWRWNLPMSREVSDYIRSWPYNFDTWNFLAVELDEHLDEVQRAGACIRRTTETRVQAIARHARPMKFDGVEIPVVNCSWDFSEIGEEIANHSAGQVGGYYFDRADGKRQWGFRATGDFDCSELCKRFGGGGHKGAAGFTSEIGWLPETKEIPDSVSEVRR